MIRQFLKLFARILKSATTPKMVSRFLMIGVREFTDRQIQQQRKRIRQKYKYRFTICHMLINYLNMTNQKQIANELECRLQYSQVHSIHIQHEREQLMELQTVVSSGSLDHHEQDFWGHEGYHQNGKIGENPEFIEINSSYTETV